MSKKTTRRRSIAAVAGLGLVAAALPATMAGASGDVSAADEKSKVAEAVTSATAGGGTTDVWISLSAAPDLSAVDGMTWQERGQYVHDSLRATAAESQADLLAELDAQGADYEAFWINNSVFVRGADADLVAEAASLRSVATVTPDFEVTLEEPVAADPAPAPMATTWGLDAINVPQVWEQYDQRGEGVVVASFDSGVDGEHPALVGKYRGTETGSNDFNWFDNQDNPSPVPIDYDAGGVSHGTHVTGTMVGGEGENEIGVAPDAQWIASANCCSASADVVATMEWFLAPTPIGGGEGDPDQRPHVINNSWGFQTAAGAAGQIPSDDPQIAPIIAGLEGWEGAGIFSTFSAGNSEGAPGGVTCDSVASPAWNDTTLYSVANFQEDGSLNPTSSRGPGENGEPGVDMGAPGTAVLSAESGGGYQELSGTSMAAPHVAGAVALLWAEFPDLQGDLEGTVALLDEAALDQEDPCGGDAADNDSWGEGRLDVLALFELAEGDDPEPPTAEVERIFGEDRYDTAAQIAAQFPDGVSTIYVANAEESNDGADALAAGAAAAKGALTPDDAPLATPDGEPAPIMLVKANEIPDATAEAIATLTPANIVILGGDTVVGEAVEEELVATGADVTRVEGANRYETAANLAAEYESGLDVVYVATGQGDTLPGQGLALADALTASSLAGSQGAPVLLTRTEALPAATVAALEELDPAGIVLVGGESAVEPQVEVALNAIAPTERLAGANRYETASLMLAGYPVDGETLYVASGQNFPDALAGASLTGSQGAPLVVVNQKVPEFVAGTITELSPQGITIFGGTAAVNQTVEDELQAILDVTSVD